MSDLHPPPTEKQKSDGPDQTRATANVNTIRLSSIDPSILSANIAISQPSSSLPGLIDKAQRLALTDPRHLAILKSLQRLAPRRAFGPRFGDGKFKPILECNNEE